MGRRGVQQLTPAQWREALEQQIREKQQSDEREGNMQRRSQSAPQQPEAPQEEGELAPSVAAQRAATTSGEMEGDLVAGRRRRFQQQSREEYLQGLQDQIEEKKRLAQEAQEKEQSRRRRMSRSEDDDTAAARREGCDEQERQAGDKRVDDTEKNMLSPELQGRNEGTKQTVLSNQEEPGQAPSLSAGVTADPVAITKIVDFCEELKKQNEDVKRQLLEQHAVLASLHSTLALEAEGAAPVAATRRRSSSSLCGSVDKALLKSGKARVGAASSTKKAPPKGSEAKLTTVLPVAPRPRPVRGETKIPLPRKRLPSSLRFAGANIIKGLPPGDVPQENSPLKKAEAKSDACGRLESTNTESKTTSPDSPRQRLAKEEDPQAKETESNFSSSRACEKLQDANETRGKSTEKKEERSTRSSRMLHETKSCDEQIRTSRVDLDTDDECPMDTESKLVHNWEPALVDDELLECTSVSVLDDRSAFIAIDRSLSDLFH